MEIHRTEAFAGSTTPSEELQNLQVPDREKVRQAIGSLGGYVYQIYQTLNAWLTLREDEVLLLEVAEDFAVLARGEVTATQVKNTAASDSLTLRKKSVSDTINSLWSFQNANPDKHVHINYLTTSEIGTERESSFPDGRAGLTYWSIAAREGTDVEPLRQALLTLDLLSDIIDFVKVATPEALRERIFCRITWVCGAPDVTHLRQLILDRLVYLGDRQGSTPSESEKAEDSLLGEILRTIIRRNDRVLSRADLLRTFEKSVSVVVPAASHRQLLAMAVSQTGTTLRADWIPGNGIVVKATRVPLPPQVIERQELVANLISAMGRTGALWLHGSSGLGKTVLAQLIVHRSERDWSFVQLRDCTAEELDFRLCRLLQALQTTGTGGVILDDIPMAYAYKVRLRLSMLVGEVCRMNGSLVVTSTRPPSPSLQTCFGHNAPSVVDVPYLSREEVAELVTLAGGDAEEWAGIIHAMCGPGHPQLVQARISGLRQRNWPTSELLDGIPGLAQPAKEVEQERDCIRIRLVSDLSENARELLYRLTLLVGYFDRELAVTVAGVAPAVDRPGEILDTLIGPWIEALADDRFNVSPLVTTGGTRTLSKSIQLEVHRQVVDQLITRHPFPADFLGMLLAHALGARHTRGLAWLAEAVLNAPDDHRQMISERLFVFPLLQAREPLLEGNAYLSAMLRFAQFRVTVWSNTTDHLPQIADRLIAETRMLDQSEIADGLRFLAINSVLAERSLNISPRKWMPLIEEIEGLLNGQGALIEHIRGLDAERTLLNGLTAPQFLFAVRASAPRRVDEVVELFTELDSLEEERRSVLLSCLDAIQHGKQLMIDAAWLEETRNRTLQPLVAADTYARLAAMAERWGETDIAVRCRCARAVMLNEYADDSEAALASLDEANTRYPNNPQLLRERAKIYYGNGKHSEALATFEQIVDAIPRADHIEKAFALRQAGISAVKIGRLQQAAGYFSEAHNAAVAAGSVGLEGMAVGLTVDNALVEFRSGHAGDAVALIRQGLLALEALLREADKKSGVYRSAVLAAILWMQANIKESAVHELDLPEVVGHVSNPQLPDKVGDIPYPPVLASWYELAALELMLGVDRGVFRELMERRKTHKIVYCECILNYHLMATYVKAADIGNFFACLPEYVSQSAYWIENLASITKENAYDLVDPALPGIGSADWKVDLHIQIAKDAILALVAAAICSELDSIREHLLQHLSQDQEAASALQPFIDSFQNQISPQGDVFEIRAYHLGLLTKTDPAIGPDEMFMVTYRLWEWLPHTRFRSEIQDILADYLGRRWGKIVEQQRFQLRQPMITVPAIDAAIRDPAKGVRKIAKVLLATEMAVTYRLGAELLSTLQES